MKLLIVLCLGTLALSAPAPQKRNQIDFLYADDEVQASVRPVELSTVEPKVTASKISDPREPAPVVEEGAEEDEEEVDDQEKEATPIASPLNLELNASENNEPSAQVDEPDNDNIENQNKPESSVTSRTESAVTDTTIRVYDEDDVNGSTDIEEHPNKEQRQEEENKPEHDQGQEQEKEQDQENEQGQENEQEQDNEWGQQQEHEQEQARNNQINQQAVIDDSYQYDDESLEKKNENSERPITSSLEPNTVKPELNRNLNAELSDDTQTVEKGSFNNQHLKNPLMVAVRPENHEYTGLVNWDAMHQDDVTQNGMNVDLKRGQLFNHGTLILEKGTFEGQDMTHPFTAQFPMKQWKMGERPEFDNWHHGPHGHRGQHGPPHFAGSHNDHRDQHGPPHFPGPHNDHRRFEGPPPPWIQRPHFHTHHFDHKSHEHKGYYFHDNEFHRDMSMWNNHWENPNSVPPRSGSSTEAASLSH